MSDATATRSATSVSIVAYDDGRQEPRFDEVAKEEPLQIRLTTRDDIRDVAVTMRTPGNDFELAAGFLFGEGIIRSRSDLDSVSYCIDRELDAEQRYNIVNARLRREGVRGLERLERHFAIGSACGVCGKARLADLKMRGVSRVEGSLTVPAAMLPALPERLREEQRGFAFTGGLHASALFDSAGTLEAIREDVGRHNAMDKLIGWGLLNDGLPFSNRIALVSGRSSFEIVQKAAAAGIPIVCSVSAPSSLAIETAQAFNVTLVGFLRGRRFNIYTGASRIV